MTDPLPTHAAASPQDERLASLEARIAAIEQAGATSEARLSIALALFDDANHWAQHFSNVRLAVVTFLSGICLGVMNFKWDHPESFLVWSTLGVWLLGMTLFVIFSMAEWRKMDQREQNLAEIKAARGQSSRQKSTPPLTGIERFTCEWRRQHDWAYAAYFLFTAIFLIAWCEWHQRIGPPRPKPAPFGTTAITFDASNGESPAVT